MARSATRWSLATSTVSNFKRIDYHQLELRALPERSPRNVRVQVARRARVAADVELRAVSSVTESTAPADQAVSVSLRGTSLGPPRE